MNYKYQRRQIFGKRLKVPKHILNKVYNCALSCAEFFEYQLDDKIPVSCLSKKDQKIVERFGIERCKTLDWKLIEKLYFHINFNIEELLMSIDKETTDINRDLYDLLKDQLKPSEYTPKMRELYKEKFFDSSENKDENLKHIVDSFNVGIIDLKEIIANWDLLKDKDLSNCLLNDKKNVNPITDSMLKGFMANFGSLASLISLNDDIYTVISTVSTLNSFEEKNKYIAQITDQILSKTYRKENDYRPILKLTDEEYKEIFKYSSLVDYLKVFNEGNAELLGKELKDLPENYIFNTIIPFSELLNYDVLAFVGTYGLKNIVDFDNECGHFFTKNNYAMLKLMNTMYLAYSSYEHDPNKGFFTKKKYDENGKFVDRVYTKDEFYEAMRRMIVYGPSNFNFTSHAPDYREMTGEFRIRNENLFISEQAPQELQNLFYTKSITPEILREHPEFIEYINGKDLNNCFKSRSVEIKDSGYVNFYTFIRSKTDFLSFINFITEYSDVLNIVFDKNTYGYLYEIRFSFEDDLNIVTSKIKEMLKKIIIEKHIVYPTHVPKKFIEENPSLFLAKDAPQELQEAFYSRTISPAFILSNPSYKEFLKSIDLELLFKYMPIKVQNEEKMYEGVNLVSFIRQVFGSDDALDVMLLYGTYIERVFDDGALQDCEFNSNFTKEDLLNELDKRILQNILAGNMKYDESIPSHFKKNNPTLFLSPDTSSEIKNKFYNREFTLQDFSDQENLFDVFANTNIACGFSKELSWAILLFNDNDDIKKANFNRLRVISTYFKIQDKELQNAFKKYTILHLNDFDLESLEKIDYILCNFKSYDDLEKYFNNIPDSTNVFGTLFEILKNSRYEWIIDNIQVSEKISYLNILKIMFIFKGIDDGFLIQEFKDYVIEFKNSIDMDKIEYVSIVLSRLLLTNSSELYTFRQQLAHQILRTNNPLESLAKVEDIFIRNNIPIVGKIYSCFEILHPDFEGFDFEGSTISPVLKKASTNSKKIIVFSDLIKSAFGSNNRSVISYVNNIEFGSNLYERIKSGEITYDMLDEQSKKELFIFSKHLETLYSNTRKGKKELEAFISSGDVLTDIFELAKKLSLDETLDYNLGDRVIRMFCGFAGINTLSDAKEYISKSIKNAEERNRAVSNSDLILEKGDFIKGIGEITYLRDILQNGSVSKEYLGTSAGSDLTPLDTDISMILDSSGTLSEKIGGTAAFNYGPIWFVLKNDQRFITTRTNEETFDVKNNMQKMEVFHTGVLGEGHYGIRTGFASSEINYIVMESFDNRVGLEIALNGFYIPVYNLEGKIVFTPNDYDKLRAKMSGLSYFGENNYVFSENLITEETTYLAQQIEQSNYEVQIKRQKILNVIKNSLEELNLKLKTSIDGDLTEGYVELIDTGSTGRGTNKPGDGDFDFMMRLDKTIISNPSKLELLKQIILRNLGQENFAEITDTGDFRLKNVQIDDTTNVDIDITFVVKTDKVSYSTDMSLQDRLATIEKTDPEKYKYVVANILLAKQVLKNAEAYKPNRGEIPQGGLGGVGIENWILQNGGSFYDAAQSFVATAEGKTFSEFKSAYQIWDFGDNFLAEKRARYPHDNFVANNMSDEGYKKMVQSLKEYLKTMEIKQIDAKEIMSSNSKK